MKKLFEPVMIGKVQCKNRIAMAPMSVLGLVGPMGGFSQRVIDYYVERARGDVGLIITGACRIEDEIERLGTLGLMISPSNLASIGELAESVHHYGSKIFVQLTAGLGRNMLRLLLDRGVKPVSASALPCYWNPDITTRALTTEEIEAIVKAFGDAASVLIAGDIDGVEIHSHEGYLLDQFATAIWNRRTDKYGGDLEGRLRFPVEIVKAIKEKAGRDFPVIYRYGLRHYMKGMGSGPKGWGSSALRGEDYTEAGRDVEEGIEMAKILKKAGVDALHIDAGCYDASYWVHPPIYQPHGCLVDMAERVKKAVSIPVIAVGRLDDPELAEKVLQEGKCDMVALGRGLLADPFWPMKVKQGKEEDIRPCIGCHDACIYRKTQRGRPLCCAVNPTVGRERLYDLREVGKRKKILVIGGGVSGMEAARVASIRGHEVTLCERTESLGGHLIEASVPQFKRDIKTLLGWYKRQLNSSTVKVKLGATVTPEDIERETPDAVIVATGSTHVIPEIKGIKRATVVTATDLLLRNGQVGSTIVVVGGGVMGCETALWLSKHGKKVKILEMLPEAAIGICYPNRAMLLDLLAFNKVEVITNTSILEIKDEGVTIIDKNFTKGDIQCDTVVLALGLKSKRELYDHLSQSQKIPHIYEIGDCKEPGRILDAIWDGFHIGCAI